METSVSNATVRLNGNTAAELSKDVVVAYLNNPNNSATKDEVLDMFAGIQNTITAMLEGASATGVSKAPAKGSGIPKTVVPAMKPKTSKPRGKAVPVAKKDAVSTRVGVHAKFPDIDIEPVVDVEDSIRGDKLVCLIDGVAKKMLKRHLRAKYGMEFHEYREFFGLKEDYPSVAPGYSDLKSREAKNQGFGLTVTKTPRIERGLEARKKGATASAENKTRITQKALAVA
jgi:predicted transcriptional regulator